MNLKYVLALFCLILAWTFLSFEKGKKFVAAVILKGLASLCFVTIGMLCSPGTDIAGKIVIGLVIGCIADVLLNLRMVFAEKGQLIFLVGILVFMIGHIMYLAAILQMSSNWLASSVIGLILTVFLMVWIFKRITAKPAFKIFGVFYIGAIMLMNSVAIGNLISNPSGFTVMFAAGAVLFLISDIVLILNTFGSEYKLSLRYTNTMLYYVGQLLIAFSLSLLA